MKKIFSLLLICVWAVTAYAVPAYPGWQTRTQADGTTIEVQVIGDEFYHYTINREGKEVREVNGQFKVVGDAPTAEEARALHEQARARHYAPVAQQNAPGVRRAPKAVGTTPNLAPKGIVILVNFKDSKMSSSHTQAVWDELCNSTNCTVNVYGNKSYPSAGQYFADQSNGSYRPQFDVYGPVTLAHNTAHYGTDLTINPRTGEQITQAGNDSLAANAVVEACQLVDQQYNVNWADYDSDNNGEVDFVYMIYAGKGQANGGAAYTIWPHNWYIGSAMYWGNCTYAWEDCIFGGKYINNYACSGELGYNNTMSGIGTLCHEFGHVMGLPDLYDITYGEVYEARVTPADWNIMDGGSYNGGEHCPPNYDPWQKLFFGWQTPIVLGTEGADIVLKANGTEGAQVYQIASTSSLKGATESGLRYYIENRQQVGWDEPLRGHGMLLWKVDFNASAWTSNSPNATGTEGAPRHTVISAYGTKIGWDGQTDNCPWNPFPGTKKVYTCTPISGHELTEITESNGIITAKYNGGYVPTSFSYQVTNAEHCTASSMSGDKTPGDTLFLTIKPDSAYTLDDASCWNVTMGGQKLKYGEGYTYIAASNLFVLPDMSGDVTISASALRTYLLTWYAQGEVFKKTISTGTLSIPSAIPASCEDARAFVGWCETEIYENEWTAPEYIQNGEAVTEDRNFYAVFAEQLAENLFDDFTTTCTPVQHNYYKIRFFDNGAQIGEEQTIREGFLPAVPSDPTPVCPEIYTFVGWWIETLDLKNMEAHSVTDFKATKDQDYFAVYRRTSVPAGGAGKLTRFVAGTDNSTSMYLIKEGVTIHVTDGTFSRDDNYRCYTNQTLTVSAEEAISQVLFNCAASGDAQYGPGCFTVSAGDYTYNGKIGIWQGEATSVIFQSGEQVRMNSIEVTTGGPASKTYYTTTEDCSLTAIDHTEVEKSAVKAIRDGQLVIIRGDKIYTATGARIE